MKKARITYVVDVDFPDLTVDPTIHLWADGIARGIEHNKPEVKHVEYDIQPRDIDSEAYQHQTEHYEQQGVPEPKKQLPEKTDEI